MFYNMTYWLKRIQKLFEEKEENIATRIWKIKVKERQDMNYEQTNK
jgi:hypothetical protein